MASIRTAAMMLVISVAALSSAASSVESETAGTSHTENSEREGVRFTKLRDGVWMHTSYRSLPNIGPFPSNGLIVLHGEKGAVLVDTAWTDAQTRLILNWVETELGRTVTAAVVTHAHEDKMGGVGALRAEGIATYAHPLSNSLAPARGLTAAGNDLRVAADGTAAAGASGDALAALEIFYPGPGHTEDNIVIGIRGTDILFGGCLIRPAGSTSLGNTADGDVANWGKATAAVAGRFPGAQIVVPSHGPPGTRDLLMLTERLAKEAAGKVESK